MSSRAVMIAHACMHPDTPDMQRIAEVQLVMSPLTRDGHGSPPQPASPILYVCCVYVPANLRPFTVVDWPMGGGSEPCI